MAVIDDGDNLLRRVRFTDPNYIREDMTVTSFAFSLRKNEVGLSVDLEKLTTHEKSIVDLNSYRLYSIKAGEVREHGLDCIHDPVQDNNAHSLIIGQMTNSKKSQLAKKAKLINFPISSR